MSCHEKKKKRYLSIIKTLILLIHITSFFLVCVCVFLFISLFISNVYPLLYTMHYILYTTGLLRFILYNSFTVSMFRSYKSDGSELVLENENLCDNRSNCGIFYRKVGFLWTFLFPFLLFLCWKILPFLNPK